MNRCLIALLLACTAIAGEVRLMGYAGLDAAGRPQGVVVAVDRPTFDALWDRAHPAEAPAQPPVALAVGPPDISLALAGDRVEGVIALPVAVPAREWQELRLPLPGAVRALELTALGQGAPPPRRSAWRIAGGELVVSLEGGQQALVTIRCELPASGVAGSREASLPLGVFGGRLRCPAPPPWTAVAGGLPVPADGLDLPTAGGALPVIWTVPAQAAAGDRRLACEQRIALALAPGRIEWRARLEFLSAGGPMTTARITLPPGLALDDAAAGGAAWRRDGASVVVTWPAAADRQVLELAGVLPRSGRSGSAVVALDIPGAAVSRGRLGLGAVADGGERFLRPEHPRLVAADPAPGEAAALRWEDHPGSLAVAWETAGVALVAERDVLLALREGRATVEATLRLAGRGQVDALRLALPEPWRLLRADCPGAVVAVDASGRWLALGAAKPWAAGATVSVQLEAETAALGAAPPLPLLDPLDGAAPGRVRLAVADAGALRVRLNAPEARPLPPEALLRGRHAAWAEGLRWRQAAELDPGARAGLTVAAEAPQAAGTFSHYLIHGREGVRWSAHLAVVPEQGAVGGCEITLPAGAHLAAASGADLGTWSLDGRTLRLRLAAASSRPFAVDLAIDVPAGDGPLVLSAPQVADMRLRQQVSLVGEDDLGLVRREVDGLAEIPAPVAPLPAGVVRAQLDRLWQATRDDWRLTLSREPLAATAGADGIASLVDGAIVLAEDGELRGTATWHVINRTRQQLPLALGAGVELWEARVDGRVVRPRADADGLWLPVAPLRPGQASTRIALTWRQAGATGPVALRPPLIGGLRIAASAWRIAAPPQWRVSRRDGALTESDPVDAATGRAQAVVDEIQRLRSVDNLGEAGMRRLEAQLAVLDSELRDHLAGLGRHQERLRRLASARQEPAGGAQSSRIDAVSNSLTENAAQIGELQQRLSVDFGNRSNRRKQLNLDALVQNWAAPAPIAPNGPDALPAALPWSEPMVQPAGAALGAGAPPPRTAVAGGTALTGIDLACDPADPVLVLTGQGGDLTAVLELAPPPRPLAPWGWLALAATGLLAGLAWTLRRRRAAGD